MSFTSRPGRRTARVLLTTAALLALTTACGPAALEGALGSGVAQDVDGRNTPAADRYSRSESPTLSEAAPSSVDATNTDATNTEAPNTEAEGTEAAGAEAEGTEGSSTDVSPVLAAPSAGSTGSVVPVVAAKAPAAGSAGSRGGRSKATGSAPAPSTAAAASSTAAAVAPAVGTPSGALVDRTSTFTAAGYSASYRLYAQGLDVSRPIGLLVYADGTGEYGINNPTSSYALGGSAGLIAVARAHNMVLVAPFSPNSSCKCWEQGDAVGYANYLAALISDVKSRYATADLWVTGYSSGAQAATRFLFPAHPELWSGKGGVVAIGGGGAPAARSGSFPAGIQSRVVMRWDTGAADVGANGGFNALSGSYGAQVGAAWYAGKGFNTKLVSPAGVGHARNGQFGTIIGGAIDGR